MDLKDSFPHFAQFSDIDWSAVAEEFKVTRGVITFPEYLEIKAEEGDCSQYLLELAYFDEALNGLQDGEFIFPDTSGIYLNPSARFLSLDYDILKMVDDAQSGKMDVIERANVLCLFVDEEGEIRFHDITTDELELLQELENGKAKKDHKAFSTLAEAGLILVNN